MADFEYVSRSDATTTTALQPPRDFSYHFSRVTLARKESQVKEFYKYFQIPGIGNLAGGLPNASLFPYDTLEAQIAQPERFEPTPNDPNSLSEKLASTSLKTPDTSASAHLTIPHLSGIKNPLQKIDLTTALQYGTAQGYPPLYSFLRQFTRENLQVNVPYLGGPEIILTCGNTDGFSKTIEAFTNPWSEERDWIRERPAILCEEFTFMNALQAATPRGVQVVPVKVDLEGMLPGGPGGLEDVLENWDESKGKRPHLMYTITIGQNPTGGTLSVQRRKEIYDICSKYDVMIIEDDPYWYLQFPSAPTLEASARGLPPPTTSAHTFDKSSGFPFLDSLVPSYLNVDTEGRVIRLDTFSKTVAPGCRLGWITAQPAIIERILRITETSTQQPSGFVQSMIAELIMGPQPSATRAQFASRSKATQPTFTGWKVDGWVRWLEGLRGVYERRMTRMCTILEAGRHQLKQGTPLKASESEWAVISKTTMYSFAWPRGGMFLWVRMHFDTHPLARCMPGPRLANALFLFMTLKPHLVLVSPGPMYSSTDQVRDERGWQYFRLCFAAETEEEADASSTRFAAAVAKFWEIRDRRDIEDIETLGGVEGVQARQGLGMGMGWGC